MGHRALVAYKRPDDLYNLHYSHWGGRNLHLKVAITESTPFGGTEANHPWTSAVHDHLLRADEVGLPEVAGSAKPNVEVDPRPLAVGVAFDDAISNHLDYQLHEVFYEVSGTFEVTAYMTFWLGFSTVAESVQRSPSVGHGILTTVRWHEGRPIDDGYRRGWFNGAKAIVAEFLDRGDFTYSQATTFLAERFLDICRPNSIVHVRRRDRSV